MNPNRVLSGAKAQRQGTSWESSIEAQNRGYQMMRQALVSRVQLAGRFAGGEFQPIKSPLDFEGAIKMSEGRYVPVRFDCKTFSGDRWSYAEWNPVPLSYRSKRAANHHRKSKHHQLKRLREMAEFGGLACVLVRQQALVNTGTMFVLPAWLIPLAVIEYYIGQGTWSLNLDTLSMLVSDKAIYHVAGNDWLPAAIEAIERGGTK